METKECSGELQLTAVSFASCPPGTFHMKKDTHLYLMGLLVHTSHTESYQNYKMNG